MMLRCGGCERAMRARWPRQPRKRRLSATLEEDLASTEEEGDRFRAGFEATERELGCFQGVGGYQWD